MDNIVILVMDTVRARNMSCYGYKKDTTPNLAGMAEDSLFCRNVTANAPWTLPSHATLLSGRFPTEHGATSESQHLPKAVSVLPERLQAEGYTSACFSNNAWLSPDRGFDRFDRFDLLWQRYNTGVDFGQIHTRTDSLPAFLKQASSAILEGSIWKNLVNLLHGYRYKAQERRAEATNRRVVEWVNCVEEPFFGCVNYMDAHLPYRPPRNHVEPFLPDGVSYQEARQLEQDAWPYVYGASERGADYFAVLEALYNGALHYLDQAIAQLVRNVEEATAGETIFVIVSDHGEHLGEHGLMDHQFSLYQDVLCVPLIIHGTGIPSHTVTAPVQLSDVAPTILKQIGLPYNDMTGRPVTEKTGGPVYAEYRGPAHDVAARTERYGVEEVLLPTGMMRAIIEEDTKLIEVEGGTRWEFDLDSDPQEEEGRKDGVKSRRLHDSMQRFFNRLDAYEGPVSEAMADDVKGRLEDLGYL